MRRDLENEDNERIATILSRDYGLVSVRQGVYDQLRQRSGNGGKWHS